MQNEAHLSTNHTTAIQEAGGGLPCTFVLSSAHKRVSANKLSHFPTLLDHFNPVAGLTRRQDENRGNILLLRMGGGHWSTFFILLFLRSLLYSCTHFLIGNSCQNVAGLQHTAQLRLALEPGTKQEARRGEACWEYYSRMVSWGNRLWGGKANAKRAAMLMLVIL